MSYYNQELIQIARDGFGEIGYSDDLLVDNYPFADFLSSQSRVRKIPLAGFAQHPPSYKNSSFGVILVNGIVPSVSDFTSLGAPHLFVINPHTNEVSRWKTSVENPQKIETFKIRDFKNVIIKNENEWNPQSILRAKSASHYDQHQQLDFFDRGLLPVLEREVHLKLDKLFRRALSNAIDTHRDLNKREPNDEEYKGLFRLIFRLVAAKLLADRQQDVSWLAGDVASILAKVNRFYFQTSMPESIPLAVRIKQGLWDEIRSGFHLQNLSLEALAYVYENTFVSNETRNIYGTHATPPEVAEFVVKQLPFEDIPSSERIVFEPFSGHAPFLTASLSRLRTLLPADISVSDRHTYFVNMLHGIEIDPFAREIARYSLILADYPNPDGWKIEEADVFLTPIFEQYLKKANIVLCNPSYNQFTQNERQGYSDLASPNKAVEVMLRVLAHPPQLLGFILPRSFTDGQLYKGIREKLVEIYDAISIIALPDNIFQHSKIETVLVLANGLNKNDTVDLHRIFIAKDDYNKFWETGKPTWENQGSIARSISISTPLWEHPLTTNLKEYLKDFPTLENVADIHRGIEYNDSILNHISDVAQDGYKNGLHRVSDGLSPYVIHGSKFIDLDPNSMLYEAYLRPWHLQKVIVNAARISGRVWRTIAAIDEDGLYCYQRFHGIWPKDCFSSEIIAAVLNGMVANALLSASQHTRDNLIKDLYSIPVPDFEKDDIDWIKYLITEYRASLDAEDTAYSLDLITQINVIVLSGYNLPNWLMSELLDYIGHEEQPRIGLNFIDQIGIRHGKLVDKKFLEGLTARESEELAQINKMLDASEETYYVSIKADIAMISSSIQQKRKNSAV